MNNLLLIAQVTIAALLSIVVLLQKSKSGFSASTAVVKHTRRGLEQFLFMATIILAVLFVGISLYNSLFIQ